MTPRSYRLGKRAQTVEDTRRRIVLAAVELHAETGIATTTMKDIALRADVGEGTVYHHFPRYEELVRACGMHLRTVTLPPTIEIFKGARSLSARVQVLVREVFAYYQRYPQYERGRCDQDKVPGLAEGVRRREAEREALVREALRVTIPDSQAVRTVSALTDFAVYRALTSSGMSAGQAAGQITEVVLAWLSRSGSPTKGRPSSTSS
jgi:AcrR family transcriptional regulator